MNSVTSSIAIAFPGQGVTPESFRRSLLRLDRHPYVERLGRLLGVDDWSAPDLVDPLIAQPALLACSLALADEIAATRDLGAAAGHSLGEIAAFTFAGAIEFEDALDLVRTRAKCCQAAAKANGGRMLSVMGLDRAQVEWVRRTVIARGGVVEVAVQNAPREWVLSGDDAAIRESAAMVRAASARTRRLAIEGAFHSPLMADALADWSTALRGLPVSTPKLPVVSSVDGCIYTCANDLRTLLERSLLLPVSWPSALGVLVDLGIRQVIDAGPGSALAKIAARTGGMQVISYADEVGDVP